MSQNQVILASLEQDSRPCSSVGCSRIIMRCGRMRVGVDGGRGQWVLGVPVPVPVPVRRWAVVMAMGGAAAGAAGGQMGKMGTCWE
jgi:hypothetical protein